jgi:hypothetical protein
LDFEVKDLSETIRERRTVGTIPGGPELRPAEGGPATRAAPEAYRPKEDVGLLTRTLGPVFVGTYRNPITGAAIRSALRGGLPLSPDVGGLPGAEERVKVYESAVEHVAQRIENSPNQDFVRISELATELAPDLALGGGALVGGRALAVRGLQEAAPSLAGRGPIGKEMARVAFKSLEDVGEQFPRMVPKIQQAIEVLGEAAGLGGYVGIEEYLESGDVTAATRDAALTFALTAGLVTGIRAGGKFFGRGRQMDPLEAEAGTGRPEFKSTLEAVEGYYQARIDKTKALISKVLKVDEHTKAVEAFGKEPALPSFGGITKPERVFSERQIERAHKLRTGLRQRRQSLRAIKRVTRSQPLPTNYTKGPRVKPGESWEAFQKFLGYIGKTPEAYFGQFGKTFAQFGEAWGRAETVSAIGKGVAEGYIHQINAEAASAMGLKSVPKDGKFLLPVIHAYEKGGITGVRQFMQNNPLGNPLGEERMVRMFRQVEGHLQDYRQLEQMGAEPWMSKEVLSRRGVTNYWPHTLKNLPDDELEKKLTTQFLAEAKAKGEQMTKEQAMLRAKEALSSGPSFGLARSGTIDHTRLFAGSLQEKINWGRPFDDDPLIGLFNHLTNVQRRMAFGREFGFRGEIGENLIALVEAETDARTASVARTFVDHALNRKFEDRALVRFADAVTSIQIGMKLPLAVIANISQTSVTTGQAGLENTLRGSVRAMRALLKGESSDDVLKSVGLTESLMGVMGDLFFEGPPKTVFGNFARWTLKYTGFDAVEKFNRLAAGSATLYDVRTTMMQAWGDRLKGATLDSARRRMAAYGLDLSKMVQRGREAGDINAMLAPGELEFAIFRGAQTTQFIPSPTRKPLPWQDRTWGRVLTQFKTFGLNYGRFLKDRVAAEAARGNYRPLVTYLGASQPAGELVADAQALTRRKGRPENSIERVLDNHTAVGGLGLMSSAYVSSRWGGLSENLLGPTVGPSIKLVENLLAGRSEEVVRQALREPIVTLTTDVVLAGYISKRLMDRFLESEEKSKSPTRSRLPAIPISDLIERSQ